MGTAIRTAIAAAIITLAGGSAPALAQGASADARAAVCPTRPFRWLEDCSALANRSPQGLQRLRYLPLAPDGAAWLTLGGEARVRVESMQDIDFGINGQPGYVETAGRVFLHADLRTRRGPRAFVQLGVVQENGRKPGPRGQDEGELDVTQAFVDAPFQVAEARGVARFGRQELDLSGNRLLTSRDGVTLRRTFEGGKVDVAWAGARLALVSVHPVALIDAPFADRVDRSERFNALSFDLPPGRVGGGDLNLFLFDRQRTDARYLRAQGPERRYTLGAHFARPIDGWNLDFQGAWQTGRANGRPVRAYALALQLDRELGGPRDLAVGLDAVAASGDKAGTRAIETFDPVYPNNGGLSDAPLFFQTNYVYGGGSVSAKAAGVTWGASMNLMARHSTEDAVYASGRPIPAAFGDQRLTSLLGQVSARAALGRSSDIYVSLVRAQALGGVTGAGGHDAFYGRAQVTTRF